MATHTLRVIREPSVAHQAGLWLLLVLVATFAVHAVSLQGFYLADDFWHLHEAARTGWLQVLDPEHYRATDDRAYWFPASHGAEVVTSFTFDPRSGRSRNWRWSSAAAPRSDSRPSVSPRIWSS